MPVPVNPCQAIKGDGNPCGRNATRNPGDPHPEHLHFCPMHKNSYLRKVDHANGTHHVEGRCFEVTGARWCVNAADPGHRHCGTHRERTERLAANREARVELREHRQMATELLVDLEGQVPPPTWQQVAQAMHAMDGVPLRVREAVARGFYENRFGAWGVWPFANYWAWLVDGRRGPEPIPAPAAQAPPPPPPAAQTRELARLARDNQNVHTGVVTEQTNTATKKLLAVKVPETQQTERTLTMVWLGGLNVSYGSYLRVANDINKWFNTKDCRARDDNMYRRLMRGLVALISSEKDDERKTEMYRRCWEECQESVGMCCEGHISRLCNVLVGFDDAFQPPVSFGELLQSKMSAIAGLDVTEEEKRRQATAFFDEHGTPAEERVAWLEAF